VPGKEYTPTGTGIPGGGNITVLVPGHGFDPHQVTAWDSNPGAPAPPPGMDDSVRDYTPFLPTAIPGIEMADVDALANHTDLFFAPFGTIAHPVVGPGESAALIFSVTTDSGFGSGPGVNPVLFERIAAAGGGGGVWATEPAPFAMGPGGDIAHGHPGSPLPNRVGGDLDGLEVWGGDGATADDSDRFSLLGDPGGVSVWAQLGGPLGPVFPLVPTAMVAALIAPTLGVSPGEIAPYIDLDGLMMYDNDTDAIEPGLDHMLFSIRPIISATGGLIADGGEIWHTDFTPGSTFFLDHGGHLWDTAFDVMGTFDTLSENVDALEAVATYVPEPTSLTLLGLGALLSLGRRRRS
jgi:hypothetical protein